MDQLTPFEQWWLNSWPHRWHIRRHVPRFLRACPEPLRGEILEVGAGAGWTSQRILETFPQVELTATDIDEQVTERFKNLKPRYGQRLNVRRADVLNLPFDRNAFDIVIAVYVMHHIDDVLRGVQQLLRVLRPGGLLGITDGTRPYMVGPLHHLMKSKSHITRTHLTEILTVEDCEIVWSQGEGRYSLWARKPFPIPPKTSQNP